MISLKDNKTSLLNLPHTIEALERIDYLIKYYSEGNKIGPAYTSFSYVDNIVYEVQIDRKIIVGALKEQRQRLVDYLATLGITV